MYTAILQISQLQKQKQKQKENFSASDSTEYITEDQIEEIVIYVF